MKRRVVVLAILGLVMLFGMVGCGNAQKETETSVASKVYALKHGYLENREADHALIHAMGIDSYGKYTMETTTDMQPYTLDIRFMYLYDNVDLEKMQKLMTDSGIVLMALIDNCELVTWKYPTDEGIVNGAIGIDYANEIMGVNLKEVGKDEATFTTLYEGLFPEKAKKAE